MPCLNREQILALINEKKFILIGQFSSQIQPASLDLTLSDKCYRIKASFIPNNLKISVIKELSLTKIDLNKNTL